MNRIFVKQHWVSIVLGIIIIYLCMMNTADLPKAPMTNFDKVVHLLMFATVAIVVFVENSCHLKTSVSNIRILTGSLLYSIVLGGGIELLQEYGSSHHRTGDWMDFLYDVLGAIIGYIICQAINKKISA